MQIHRTAILVPLAVGTLTVIAAIVIHALPLGATVQFIRREKSWAMWARASGSI